MIRTVVYYCDSHVFGGAEQMMLQLMAGLDRRAWRPVLFVAPAAGLAPLLERASALKVSHHVVPRIETIRDIMHVPGLWRRLRAERPAIFHANMTWPLSCKYAVLAARLAGVPAIIATTHTSLDVEPALRAQPRLMARLVDRYVAVSTAVATHLSERLRIPAGKVVVIRNGIAPPPAISMSRASTRHDLMGTAGGSLIVSVARLEPAKGLRDLIRAAQDVPDATFVLVGDGPQREELEAEARRTGLGPRVRFLGMRTDAHRWLTAADVFVLPSRSEGLPLSVLEAMRLGTPVVASDIPGIDELVTATTGTLVPPGDPAALAAAIRQVLNTPRESADKARAAQERIATEFSLERMVRAITSLYDQVLG